MKKIKLLFLQPTNYTPSTKKRAFTLVELMVVIGITTIFFSLVSPNLLGAKHTASLDETVQTIIADIRLQQSKAMTGDTEGRGTNDTYGIYFTASNYVLFHGASYNGGAGDNVTIPLADQVQLTSVAFPTSQIVFSKGSGDLTNFTVGSNTFVVRNTQTGEQKTVTINRRGVVTSVN